MKEEKNQATSMNDLPGTTTPRGGQWTGSDRVGADLFTKVDWVRPWSTR